MLVREANRSESQAPEKTQPVRINLDSDHNDRSPTGGLTCCPNERPQPPVITSLQPWVAFSLFHPSYEPLTITRCPRAEAPRCGHKPNLNVGSCVKLRPLLTVVFWLGSDWVKLVFLRMSHSSHGPWETWARPGVQRSASASTLCAPQ